jgi:hypothetical protein
MLERLGNGVRYRGAMLRHDLSRRLLSLWAGASRLTTGLEYRRNISIGVQSPSRFRI